MNIEKHMTQEMLDCMLDNGSLQEQWCYCRRQEAAAHKAANISLPATAASGEPVIHGARLAIMAVEEYWHARRKATELLLSPLTVRALETEYDD